MNTKHQATIGIPEGLIDAIRSLPVERETEHCGVAFLVSALDIYADCPRCGTRIKLRAFSGADEIEDLVDAVLEWMSDPRAREAAVRRQEQIEADL